MQINNQAEDSPVATAYFKVYEEYAKVLRAWLVAYGVGGPILFLTNDSIYTKISTSNISKLTIYAFFVGVALQIFIAILNKYMNWYLHYGENNQIIKSSISYKICYWVSDQVWIDILCDLGAIALFGYATLTIILEFTKGAI